MTTFAFIASTSPRRRRRRRRPSRRPGCAGSRRARPAPWARRARARATPGAKCCRRARATTPATCASTGPSAGPATVVTSTSPGATRSSSHSQLTTRARPSAQPIPEGWPSRLGCDASQIPFGTVGSATRRGRAWSSLIPDSSARPFDLHRPADHVFALSHQQPELRDLLGVEAARARERARQRLPSVDAGDAVVFARPSADSFSAPPRSST